MALAETLNWRWSSSANCVELGRAAGHQDEVVMVVGKELGQFVSNAARGAGDESGLVHAG